MILSMLGIALDGAAQTGPYETNAYVETIAGSGFIGHVDGQGVSTMFNGPGVLTVDSHTNVYAWDAGNRAIRKIDQSLNVTTVLSNFYGGLIGLFAVGEELLILGDDLFGPSDAITLWWIASSGATNKVKVVTIAAGNVNFVGGLVQTANGVFFTINNQIYILTNDVAAVFAGSGNNSSIDGQGIFCSFNQPLALAADAANNLYVAQPSAIRKVTPQGVVTTLMQNSSLHAMTVNPGGIVCWSSVYSVHRIASGNTSILGGKDSLPGFNDGESAASLFGFPQGLAFGPDHKLYVSDAGNQRIRRIVFDSIPSFQLGIELRPTVILNGPIGRTYRIETRDSVSQQWNSVESVTLTSSPQVWLDPRPRNSKRFYRTVEQP